MKNRKFKVPIIPSTTNKTIRFPNDIISRVEQEIKGSSCNFSQFVIEATRWALENLEEQRSKK